MTAHHPDADAALRPLLDAPGAAEREEALGRLLVERGEPIVDRVIRRAQLRSGFQPQDIEDLRANVTLRLVQKLNAVCDSPFDDPIRSFEDFVAMTAWHAVDDLMRKRHPQRALLKSRVRQLLADDARFIARTQGRDLVAALAAWPPERVARKLAITREAATPRMLDTNNLPGAVHDLLAKNDAPLELDHLVGILIDLWQVGGRTDAKYDPEAVDRLVDVRPSASRQLEAKQSLELLWNEILQLPGPQRAALLLNLRDANQLSAVPLLIISGVTTLDEIAAAVDLTRAQLEAIWDDLPIDDLRLGSMLGLTRQQIINLRKSARERLVRRRQKQGF